MNVKRELMLAKLRQRKAELEVLVEHEQPNIAPVFVRNSEMWFLPPLARQQHAYQQWILEQLP